ncbi:hypothetical protein DM01DRAFT_1041730 [Hesseltinella vesiculosa]|uniref:Secreted protein n=1 Tax=Hesseltinella vesiculosa TaxID=101127 RepID=A0A1X2GHL1_9FUNG|nr:hypothetical protein DM01DRAFT_1041730 [Hesseltinella vesiculosa]
MWSFFFFFFVFIKKGNLERSLEGCTWTMSKKEPQRQLKLFLGKKKKMGSSYTANLASGKEGKKNNLHAKLRTSMCATISLIHSQKTDNINKLDKKKKKKKVAHPRSLFFFHSHKVHKANFIQKI